MLHSPVNPAMRNTPHVIATRVTSEQLQATTAAARARGQTLSAALREACVTLLSAAGVDPVAKLAAVAKLLGLPRDASADDIIQAIGELAPAPETPPDPLASGAEAPPETSAFSRLSPHERVRAAALGITNDAQLTEFKRKSTRRA